MVRHFFGCQAKYFIQCEIQHLSDINSLKSLFPGCDQILVFFFFICLNIVQYVINLIVSINGCIHAGENTRLNDL